MTIVEPPAHAAGKTTPLRRYLLDLIGDLQPHDRLPTERDLAAQFATTRLTVRRVLDALGHEGRLYRLQGAGTFVSPPRIAKSVQLTSFSDDMRARGLVPGALDTRVALVPAGVAIGAALALSPRDDVVHIARTRTADGVSMALEHAYLPASLVPGLVDRVWTGSLYELLWTFYGLRAETAEQSIRASVLDKVEAAALAVPEFSPAFAVDRVTLDARGRRLEFARSTYRADRYSYDLTLYRQTGAA
jgi:GntR family transcriptional regulator